MDSHAAIKIGFGCTHLDGDAEALKHLATAFTKNV